MGEDKLRYHLLLAKATTRVSKSPQQLVELRMGYLDILLIHATRRPPIPQKLKSFPIQKEMQFQLFGILYFFVKI